MKHKFYLIPLLLLIVFSLLAQGCVPKSQAEIHFKNAVEFMELQMFKEAVIELKNGLRLYEKDKNFTQRPESKLLKAAVLTFENKNNEAVQVLKHSIKEHKKYWDSYVLLGFLYMQKKEYKNAIAVLEKVPQAEFNYGQADFVRAIKYFEEAKYNDSIERLKLAQKQFQQGSLEFKESSGSMQFIRSGANVMISYLLARACEESGRLREALIHYKEVESISPSYPGLGHNIAIVLRQIDIERNPRQASLYNSIGWSYLQLRKYPLAIKYLKKAVGLDPKLSMAYNNMGLAYYELEDYARAKGQLKKAIDLNNDQEAKMYAFFNLGRILRREGDIGSAVTNLEDALKIDPASGPAKMEFKIALLLQMAKKRPQDKSVYEDLGASFFDNNEIDNAIEAFKNAQESAKNHYNLGQAYQSKNDLKSAENNYKKALSLDADYWRANYALANALMDRDAHLEAIDRFAMALASAPEADHSKIIDDLAYAYLEKGDASAAKKHWQEFLKISGDAGLLEKRKMILSVLGG